MGWEAGKKSTKPREMKGEIDGTWPASKAILHSSMPSREQRAMSHHCNFGFLTVIPLILIFQACYLCLIPLFPNNRQFHAGRFGAAGEKSRTASCPPVSHLEETDTFLHPTLLSRRLSPKLSPDTLNVNKAGPPHPHTQRVT